MIDQARIVGAVRTIIDSLGGEDAQRPGLVETPRRIAEMYAEVFSGIEVDPVDELRTGFEEGHQEMVILKDIPFYSMCEHHFMPFYGIVHVGYIPSGRIVGIGKLARVVEVLSKRPQLQERLTSQIADTVMEGLNPRGVGVVIQAEHLCMTMRGIKKPGSNVVTSANRGIFRRNYATRTEFLELVNGRGTSSS